MPRVALEVPETYDNITRPITTGVVRDLIERFNLPNTIGLRYQGSAETVAQDGSVLAKAADGVRFPFSDQVKVDMEETYLEEGVLTTAVKKRENNAIFADFGVQTFLKPVYTKTQVTLSFRYRSPDKSSAMRFRDMLRRKATEGRDVLLHEVDYHYSLPNVFLVILSEIHRLREHIAGYDEDLAEWFRKHFTHTLTGLSNLSGTETLLAIAEKQIGIQGWFDFIAEPDNAERLREGDTWAVGFNYTFQYDKVTAVYMQYPIVVHNQLLSSRFVNTEPVYDLYQQPRRPSWTGMLSELFSPHSRRAYPRLEGVIVPSYDDWLPSAAPYQTIDIVTSLIGVEFDYPHRIVNLTELGEFIIDPGIVAFLKKYHKKLTQYLHSVFHVTFYRGDRVQDTSSLVVDEDLTIWSKTELDPRDVHHFRISVVAPLVNLTPEAEEALRRDPVTLIKVINLIEDTYRPILSIPDGGDGGLGIGNYNPRGGWTGGHQIGGGEYGGGSTRPGTRPPLSDGLEIIGDRLVTKPSYDKIIGKLPTTPDVTAVDGGRGLKSVMLAGIIAHKG
jgi:hypothetical protein